MKKITSLLILLSMFLMPISSVYAAEIGGTINEVLVPTQSATKSAVLYIPVNSCVLGSSSDYCRFYVDLNGTRVSSINVTTSTPKVNKNKYYQLTFDYSNALTKGKKNTVKVTTGSTSIETYGFTPKETSLTGTCGTKANMVEAQGVILTRRVGTKKVEEFEELINIINGPAGYDVAAGTGIEYPMYLFYTYQGKEYLNYFDYDTEMNLNMYSPYLPDKVNKVYPYNSTYSGYQLGYEKTNFQQVNNVVLFTELLLEQLEGKGIKSDIEKGTAGEGYVEIPGSCVTKYKWRKVEKITYTELEECKEVDSSSPVPDGYARITGVKICRSACHCVKKTGGSPVATHYYDGSACDCFRAKRQDGNTVLGLCLPTMSTADGGSRQKNYSSCISDANDYKTKNCDPYLKYQTCTYFSWPPYVSCKWNNYPYFCPQCLYNSCMNTYNSKRQACINKWGIGAETQLEPGKVECYPNSPINWGESIDKYKGSCEYLKNYKIAYGNCKKVTKSYNRYEYYNGSIWVPGDSSYARWTIDNFAGISGVEKMAEAEFCSYYKADELEQTDQVTGLITYELPRAYVEKGTGYIYNDDNKNSAVNPFIKDSGERKVYTDLRAVDDKNYTLRIIGRNIGFNKYSYDLSCRFNLLANGLFDGNKGTGLIVYRPIDPKDPFPRYAPLANWLGKEYLITKKGYGVYTLVPEYELTLTSLDISNIRSYNASNKYLDYKLNKKEESDFIHKSFSNLFRIKK